MKGLLIKKPYRAVKEEVKRRTSNKNPPKTIPKYPFRKMIRCGTAEQTLTAKRPRRRSSGAVWQTWAARTTNAP